MNFLEALKTGRPMRRADWMKAGPLKSKEDQAMQKMCEQSWVFPRQLLQDLRETAWFNILSGQPLSLTRDDYMAEDWEAMP